MTESFTTWLDIPEWLQLLMWAMGIVIAIRLFFIFLKSRIKKTGEDRYKTKKVLDAISYVLIILALLIAYNKDLGGLTVALGVAGAGIAFALQEVIVSVAGWMALMFGNFYKTGDRIQLGGIRGDVIDISMLRTTLMETGQWVDGDLYNGRIVRVANSFVFKEPVFNYSGDFPFLWDEIKIPIQYGSDYQLAREILERVAEQHVAKYAEEAQLVWKDIVRKYLIENAQVKPMISLAANDNWVEFTMRYVVNYKRRRFTKSELFTAILKEVSATNGKVRFGSATFELVGAPPFDVNLNNK
ncbi:MAG: mechanosensitive ion channel family protein [Cyclobacteriaceae bacterium]